MKRIRELFRRRRTKRRSIKQILVTRREKLQEIIEPSDDFLSKLVLKGILQHWHCEEVLSNVTVHGKNKQLLEFLLGNEYTGDYNDVLDALKETDQDFVFNYIIADGVTVLMHVIPAGNGRVVGVTALRSQLFVVRETAKQLIEAYDTAKFTLQRNISVPGLQCAYGLASCTINSCLYASNFNNNRVYRTELSNANTAINSSWQVGPYPAGLSTNHAGNVLVTCYDGNKIQEYATAGSLIREISLQQAGITNPWHSVQLSDGQFLVTHYHRVCVINVYGTLISSCGSTTAGSANGQFNWPATVATLKNGCILIADCSNNRIQIWNRVTNIVRDLKLPTNTALQCPLTFHLDEALGRLFIGEYNGNRVLVFDNVSDLS